MKLFEKRKSKDSWDEMMYKWRNVPMTKNHEKEPTDGIH